MEGQDIDIVVLTLADKSDNSPAHMVSEKWMKQQRKIKAASRAVMKRFQALLAANDRLREVLREGERMPENCTIQQTSNQ